MLTGTGVWVSIDCQLHNIPPTVIPLVRDIAMASGMRMDMRSDFRSSYIKIIPGPSEAFADFTGRFKIAAEKQVKGEQDMIKRTRFNNVTDYF